MIVIDTASGFAPCGRAERQIGGPRNDNAGAVTATRAWDRGQFKHSEDAQLYTRICVNLLQHVTYFGYILQAIRDVVGLGLA